ELTVVHTDPLRLRLIVRNLINNAIKFTPAGEVDVQVSTAGTDLCIEVRDSGIGIPSPELVTIFDPFVQAHGSQSRIAGGTGLGLYIVRRLVESLGGAITVSSEVGSGSCFFVRLPLNR
ncbi:MAG TPA: ATP-binding protein, partial [Terriglobales bacterium]|nr:ATP-binding protein [Terriglobales bacterium]